LVLPERGGVQVRVSVGEVDEAGQRTVQVHSRAEDAGPGSAWTRHVSGNLAPEVAHPDFELTQWPPAGAVEVEGAAERAYAEMAETGYGYGPAFRGLSRVWTRGEEVFAELVLPEEAGKPDGFGVHPALIDACFHAGGFRTDTAGQEPKLILPFAWNDVRIFATGATALRVHLSFQGSDTITVRMADGTGAPVASVGSWIARPVTSEFSRSDVSGGRMFRVVWERLSVRPVEAGPGFVPVASVEDVRALVDGAAVPEVLVLDVVGGQGVDAAGVRALTGGVLEVVQAWLAEPALAESRLVAVSRGAVAVGGEESPVDLAAAAVGGLLRSAQVENPGRVVLVDVDAAVESRELLAAVSVLDEPQVAVRDGVCFVRRLARVAAGSEGVGRELDREGTVLVTGGTGALGALVARHVIETHGVRNVLLVSRRGDQAPGAGLLAEELTALGANVRVEGCDVADRDAVAALLASIPASAPLTAVVHTAGVIDDGVVTALTPERLDTVFRPKVDAALVLDELTRDLDLAAFVLYSSAAGTFQAPGQGNYAAANAFLDALAQRRRAAGLAATSLAWGLWSQATEMNTSLSDVDQQRMARGGVIALSAEEGMGLFDAALQSPTPALVLVGLDFAELRNQAGMGRLPALLRALVPAGRRSAQSAAAGADGLLQRLAGVSQDEREQILLDVVQQAAAAVLGFASSDQLEPERALNEIGFDSLTAVELRNSLSGLTGLRLPTTLIFDHPTPMALMAYLRDELDGGAEDEVESSEADIRRALATVPIDRLRAAGVLNVLLSLARAEAAGQESEPAASVDEELDLIDGMNIGDLVQRALGNTQS
ncbi:type I polyketide synthase, partial [Streptomyces wedmorensis]